MLSEPISGNRYPIINYVPRFVSEENYAENFGVQWNIHSRTQYDDHSGFSVSKERFMKETKWDTDLRGQMILEIGSGSGRFTKHALDTGALVVSCDYSSAVEANLRSNGGHPNLLLVQASVYDMPFRLNSFNKAFCFGVLQHTPDPRRAFLLIIDYLKPGGKVASDVYARDIRHWLLHTKYWVRPFVRKAEPAHLYKAITRYVDFMWPLARKIRKVPRIGYAINWRLLVADYSRQLPQADEATLKEWAYLDTFDMLSPIYDTPQTLKAFKSWHREAGLTDLDVRHGYNGLEGRATKQEMGST